MEGGEEIAHQEETEGWLPPPLCIPSGGRRAGRSSLSGCAAPPAAASLALC